MSIIQNEVSFKETELKNFDEKMKKMKKFIVYAVKKKKYNV